MSGYRRVRSCGEPCSEDYDCPSCICYWFTNFCTGSTYDTVCPSTVVATITTPSVERVARCCHIVDGDTVCFCENYTVPGVSTEVTLTESSSGSCSFRGEIDTGSAWSYMTSVGINCDVPREFSWDGMRIIVYILPGWLPGLTNLCSSILAPCSTGPDDITPSKCKGFVIGVNVAGYNATDSLTYYTFADAYKASDHDSCDGSSTLCWNEMSDMYNYSSHVFCPTGETHQCCGDAEFYASTPSGIGGYGRITCQSYAGEMQISIA